MRGKIISRTFGRSFFVAPARSFGRESQYKRAGCRPHLCRTLRRAYFERFKHGTQRAKEKRMGAESRVAELKLELPPAPKPVGVYKPVVIAGNMAYLSGHGPLKPDKTLVCGTIGAD